MTLPELDIPSRAKWRSWLDKNHTTSQGIWLICHKQHTGKMSMEYEDIVREALCFGWIDSLVKRLDDDRYARKLTPRKPTSAWSDINRQRWTELEAAGRLASMGKTLAPTANRAVAPEPYKGPIPSYILQAIKKHPKAWKTFDQLVPKHQLRYGFWIDTAKREETKQKRLAEAISLLEAGKQLGLK